MPFLGKELIQLKFDWSFSSFLLAFQMHLNNRRITAIRPILATSCSYSWGSQSVPVPEEIDNHYNVNLIYFVVSTQFRMPRIPPLETQVAS